MSKRPFLIYYSTTSAIHPFVWWIIATSWSRCSNLASNPHLDWILGRILAKPKLHVVHFAGLLFCLIFWIIWLPLLYAVFIEPFDGIWDVVYAELYRPPRYTIEDFIANRITPMMDFCKKIPVLLEILVLIAKLTMFLWNTSAIIISEQRRSFQTLLWAVKGHGSSIEYFSTNEQGLDVKFLDTAEDENIFLAYLVENDIDIVVFSQLQCSQHYIRDQLAKKNLQSQFTQGLYEEFGRMIESLQARGDIEHEPLHEMVTRCREIFELVNAGQQFDTTFYYRESSRTILENTLRTNGRRTRFYKFQLDEKNSWHAQNESIDIITKNHSSSMLQTLASCW